MEPLGSYEGLLVYGLVHIGNLKESVRNTETSKTKGRDDEQTTQGEEEKEMSLRS